MTQSITTQFITFHKTKWKNPSQIKSPKTIIQLASAMSRPQMFRKSVSEFLMSLSVSLSIQRKTLTTQVDLALLLLPRLLTPILIIVIAPNIVFICLVLNYLPQSLLVPKSCMTPNHGKACLQNTKCSFNILLNPFLRFYEVTFLVTLWILQLFTDVVQEGQSILVAIHRILNRR